MSLVSDVESMTEPKFVVNDRADIPKQFDRDYYRDEDVLVGAGGKSITRVKHIASPPDEVALFGKASPLFQIFQPLKPESNTYENLLRYQELRAKILEGRTEDFTKEDIVELIEAKDRKSQDPKEGQSRLAISLSVGDDGIWVWAYTFKWLDDKFIEFTKSEKIVTEHKKTQDRLDKIKESIEGRRNK